MYKVPNSLLLFKMCFRRQMSHQLLSLHMDHTYAIKERSPKNPAFYSDMDWKDDEFTKYKLPIDENNLYPVEALCSDMDWSEDELADYQQLIDENNLYPVEASYFDMDWSEDEFADCQLLIGADKLYTVEAQPILRRLLTAPMKEKKTRLNPKYDKELTYQHEQAETNDNARPSKACKQLCNTETKWSIQTTLKHQDPLITAKKERYLHSRNNTKAQNLDRIVKHLYSLREDKNTNT